MSRQSLSRLSNRDLVIRLDRLVGVERARLVDILEHLIEVERRKLHLEAGCSSLFDYCVSRLRYSQSAAGRRIAAARALRRFPDIGPLLESGEINLVTLSMVAKLLTPGTKDTWIARIRGRSQREVQRLVAEVRPETATPDRVQPVCIREVVVAAETGAVAAPAAEKSVVANEAGPSPDAGAEEPRQTAAALVPAEPPPTRIVHKHKIQFVVGDEFMEKLETMKALMSHRVPDASLEQVFDLAIEAYLNANCPRRRKQRRDKRRRKSTTAPGKSLPPVGVDRAVAGAESVGVHSQKAKEPVQRAVDPASRHIPARIRDEVFVRDGGRCSYTGPDGRRCGSRLHLEIDHIEPFGFGGAHTADNLRVVCHAHNLLLAERSYGREKMAAFARRE